MLRTGKFQPRWHLGLGVRRNLSSTLDETTAKRWAEELGLAISPLFGPDWSTPEGPHVAFLDGRRASFVWSALESSGIDEALSRSWRWSSDLAHHVLAGPGEIAVRSG